MATREPWEYEGAVGQATAEVSCACGCHTGWTAASSAQGGPYWPPPHHQAPIPPPPGGIRPRVANTAWLRWGKSLAATVLAMFILVDVGANAAHNAGAVVSRIVPIMHDQPFYFDPLAVVHDIEKVINS